MQAIVAAAIVASLLGQDPGPPDQPTAPPPGVPEESPEEPEPPEEPSQGGPIVLPKVRPTAISGLRGGGQPVAEHAFPEPSRAPTATTDPSAVGETNASSAAATPPPRPVPPPTVPATAPVVPIAPVAPVAPPAAAPFTLTVNPEWLAFLAFLVPAAIAASWAMLGPAGPPAE
jgi:hypothetical protein